MAENTPIQWDRELFREWVEGTWPEEGVAQDPQQAVTGCTMARYINWVFARNDVGVGLSEFKFPEGEWMYMPPWACQQSRMYCFVPVLYKEDVLAKLEETEEKVVAHA